MNATEQDQKKDSSAIQIVPGRKVMVIIQLATLEISSKLAWRFRPSENNCISNIDLVLVCRSQFYTAVKFIGDEVFKKVICLDFDAITS